MPKPAEKVSSMIGMVSLDDSGSPVGAARLDPANTYGAVSMLLKEYIDNGSEKAWEEIKTIIDRIYTGVDSALESLDNETSFSQDVTTQMESGKRLFFKPNLVVLPLIDYKTHGPGIPGANTPWEFTAAVMRWFHDKRGVSYHCMTVGEAGMTTMAAAETASLVCGTPVTREAVMEGKYGDGYGGWGFYFARKYLAECHDLQHTDDPMSGYQQSLDGLCLPPGQHSNKLLIYDLNVLNESNSRDVPVPDGINYDSITLHKVLIGGDPQNDQDTADWPGCYLVNLAKLKIHVAELFTCALKNIGMGFFGMEVNASREPGKYRWKYSVPNFRVPLFKMNVPHSRWVISLDEDTTVPLRDEQGNYLWKRTGGIEANIADAIQAVNNQKVSMLHVIDAIETTNINHSGPEGVTVPEGFVFAATDPVAADTLGARYLYSMVPLEQVDEIAEKFGIESDVIQKTPLPVLEGRNIITGQGYDSSFSRYHGLKHCEERGLGQRKFYVVGNDLWQGGVLGCVKQHLGRVENGAFKELLTDTVYHAPNKPLLDFQRAIFTYLDLDDLITGSSFKKQVLETFDENGDGTIDYLETGKRGSLAAMAIGAGLMGLKIDPGEALRMRFLIMATQSRISRKEWNTGGHDFGGVTDLMQAVTMAFNMSRNKEEKGDPLFPGRSWGEGKWPSLQYVLLLQDYARVYGQAFPDRIDILMSLYGMAFSYADMKYNQGRYCSPDAANEDIIGKYHKAIAGGEAALPFTMYVPPGLGSYEGRKIPNTEETGDSQLVFLASFRGEEIWRELHLSGLY
ncbi:MAG: DUF362 domain-containing protein [Dehalococcoidales bacterium]|nr:DUF362 domain-containing protein [Dehalococcoidales bacterium]